MCAPAHALRQADALYAELKPHLADMTDNNDPSVVGLTFSDIEANAAAIRDLLAKLMVLRALAAQPPATDEEVAAIRRKVSKSADPGRATHKTATTLNMTRQKGKRSRINIVRSEITFERDYLHFPERGTGLSPPGGTLGGWRALDDPARLTASRRARRRSRVPLCGRQPRRARHRAQSHSGRPGARVSSQADALKALWARFDGRRRVERGAESGGAVVDRAGRFTPGASVPAEPPWRQTFGNRTNEANAPRRTASTPPENRGSRENKTAVITRVIPGHKSSSPKKLMKTFVATTDDINSLVRDFRTEADRRGVGRAKTIVALSNHGHGIPGMRERHFRSIAVNRVTDF